jgi:hypothetical protein
MGGETYERAVWASVPLLGTCVAPFVGIAGCGGSGCVLEKALESDFGIESRGKLVANEEMKYIWEMEWKDLHLRMHLAQ